VRAAAGLAPRELPSDAPRAHVVAGESPRSKAWARLLAAERAKRGELVAVLDAPREESGSKAIELAVRAADYASGAGLPRAPDRSRNDRDRAARWNAGRRGRGVDRARERRRHREAESLPPSRRRHRVGRTARCRTVLTELAAKKRKNVLIVPAVWDAEPALLRDLRRSVRAFENQMTLQWPPVSAARRAIDARDMRLNAGYVYRDVVSRRRRRARARVSRRAFTSAFVERGMATRDRRRTRARQRARGVERSDPARGRSARVPSSAVAEPDAPLHFSVAHEDDERARDRQAPGLQVLPAGPFTSSR
jgi:hypothetical protein